MPDYLKVELTATLSENSDYSSPYSKRVFKAYEITTPTDGGLEKVTCDTGGTSFSVAKYSAMTEFTFKNLDAANYVTVLYYSVGGAAQVQTARVPAGGVHSISDPDPTRNSGVWTFTANGASVKAEVFVAGT
mgnify:CR=1 FL=1